MLIFVILLSMPKVVAQPMPPCVFSGYVNVGGNPAPDDLIVTAKVVGINNLNWTAVTKDGTYSIVIPSDKPDTSEKDGGINGDIIEFYINDAETGQTATFESGRIKEVDLSISEIPEGPKSDNPLNIELYVALIIVIVISIVAVLIYKKGYRIRISRKT